jgi:nucleotide-binding universal stress UspA family protein
MSTEPAEATANGAVVVGYDGSADADRGLDWAIEYARRRRLPVEVVAASGDVTYLPERTNQEVDSLVEEWLALAEERLIAAGLESWNTRVTSEKAVPALLLAGHEAALLVLGAQGHGFVGGMVLGSVSQHVTRHADCPVVVVRPAPGRGRVVVGVDGSSGSERALAFAFEYAAAFDATVVAVSGKKLQSVSGPWSVTVDTSVADELASIDAMLHESVAGLAKRHPQVPVETLALPVSPVRSLVDASGAADLVVVGTRGLGGFMGLLLGSVSAGALQEAQCPVAVVR